MFVPYTVTCTAMPSPKPSGTVSRMCVWFHDSTDPLAVADVTAGTDPGDAPAACDADHDTVTVGRPEPDGGTNATLPQRPRSWPVIVITTGTPACSTPLSSYVGTARPDVGACRGQMELTAGGL